MQARLQQGRGVNRAIQSAQKCYWAKTVSLSDWKVLGFVEDGCSVQVVRGAACFQ